MYLFYKQILKWTGLLLLINKSKNDNTSKAT